MAPRGYASARRSGRHAPRDRPPSPYATARHRIPRRGRSPSSARDRACGRAVCQQLWTNRAVAHERFEVKGLTTRGDEERGRCGWPQRVHERCQWINAHGQSTSLLYGNPAPDARLGRIMAMRSTTRARASNDRCVGGMITAIRLSREQTRRVFRAAVSIHQGLMPINSGDPVVSRGFPC